jgi:hypothetical protein
MQDRVILTVDEDKVKRDVIRAGKSWLSRSGMAIDMPWPVL